MASRLSYYHSTCGRIPPARVDLHRRYTYSTYSRLASVFKSRSACVRIHCDAAGRRRWRRRWGRRARDGRRASVTQLASSREAHERRPTRPVLGRYTTDSSGIESNRTRQSPSDQPGASGRPGPPWHCTRTRSPARVDRRATRWQHATQDTCNCGCKPAGLACSSRRSSLPAAARRMNEHSRAGDPGCVSQ